MLSSKPVITCADSGGPLEFVVDGETGLVVAPQPTALAGAVDALLSVPSRAGCLGRAGKARYQKPVTGWDHVVDMLRAERV